MSLEMNQSSDSLRYLVPRLSQRGAIYGPDEELFARRSNQVTGGFLRSRKDHPVYSPGFLREAGDGYGALHVDMQSATDGGRYLLLSIVWGDFIQYNVSRVAPVLPTGGLPNLPLVAAMCIYTDVATTLSDFEGFIYYIYHYVRFGFEIYNLANPQEKNLKAEDQVANLFREVKDKRSALRRAVTVQGTENDLDHTIDRLIQDSARARWESIKRSIPGLSSERTFGSALNGIIAAMDDGTVRTAIQSRKREAVSAPQPQVMDVPLEELLGDNSSVPEAERELSEIAVGGDKPAPEGEKLLEPDETTLKLTPEELEALEELTIFFNGDSKSPEVRSIQAANNEFADWGTNE